MGEETVVVLSTVGTIAMRPKPGAGKLAPLVSGAAAVLAGEIDLGAAFAEAR